MIKENEIRPKDLMEGQKIAVLADIKLLLTKKDEFVNVECPACNSKESEEKFEKNGLEYHSCRNCGTLFINPRPSSKVLDFFYKNSKNYEYWNKYIFPASEQKRREKIFIPRVDKVLEICEKYNVKTNSLLEVGSAFGTFCVEMKSRNKFKRIVGVEPTPNLAKTCREKGIEVIEDFIENIYFEGDEKFDVIVNFEVIEHLFSSKDFIIKCRSLLKKGGIIILTCPNGMGFDIITLGKISNAIDHEHLNYFNPISLSILLKSCGFQVLNLETPGRLDAELVRNKVIEGEFDILNNQFLKRVLIDDWEKLGEPFQKFISENLLSSNMMIIAKNIWGDL